MAMMDHKPEGGQLSRGTATIDVSTEILAYALMLFPSTYKVIGSAPLMGCEAVRLVVESEEIPPGVSGLTLTCEVNDVGSVRTATMKLI